MVFRLGAFMSLAYGVAQWSNWPMISSVCGWMPCAGTARPCVAPITDLTSIRSPSSMPSESAVRLLITHAAVAAQVAGHLVHQLDRRVARRRRTACSWW